MIKELKAAHSAIGAFIQTSRALGTSLAKAL